MFAVIVWDDLDYRQEPLFVDRDSGRVRTFETREEAERVAEECRRCPRYRWAKVAEWQAAEAA